ncbi:BnaC01g37350D [Brassica napus]|uniref:BnaC01g37350D protein n=1 Tax=Brassica napus TaxID=3708 RepID=A0A078HI22_BRANA|nr:BnaC01g37350D [Brassica napus]
MEPTAATAAAVAYGNRFRDAAAVKGYIDDSAADQTNDYQMKIKKSKSIPNGDGAASRSWSFSDPESRRKRRVAGYKVYSVKQKMKGSIRKSFKWNKMRFIKGHNGISNPQKNICMNMMQKQEENT